MTNDIDWNEFKGEYVKWTSPGQNVEGTVVDIGKGSFKGKSYPELKLDTSEGTRIVSASQASLMFQLADDPPQEGERIRVEYLGEDGNPKPGQSPKKLFRYTRKPGAEATGVDVKEML